MTISPSIRPPRSGQPSGNELPLALRSVPVPKISLNPARSLLPDLTRLSLLAPATGPRRTRGHGLFAGLAGSVAAAVVDGLMSADGLTPGDALAVVVHCVGVCAPVGALFGLLLEALLAAGARVVVAIRAWRWIASGPRVWFAPDPGLATRIFLTLFGVCAVVTPVFAVSRAASIHMRSPLLIGVTCAATCVAALVLVPFAWMLLTPVVRTVFERCRPLSLPGGLLLVAAAASALFVELGASAEGVQMNLRDGGPACLAAVLVAVAAGALLALRRGRRAALALRHVAALVALVGAGLGASATALDQSGDVVRAVAARSSLAGSSVRALRWATDRDGDGASALFGGGDCDDRDPARHPAALDIPHNGVDENCSGEDAQPLTEVLARRGDVDTGLPPGARPSFVLITVDTLRPDHLGAYGYGRPTSPNIDAFARGAARFDNAYSVTPRTARSFSAIWTGHYPSRIAWGGEARFPILEQSNTTLAEVLKGVGYATGAFVGTSYFRLVSGFFQGFTTMRDDFGLKADSQASTRAAAAWIRERAGAPFFAWVHLLDAHAPYRAPPGSPRFGVTDVDRYDEEIERADLALAAVFEAIADVKRVHPERPVVTIFAADHGEGLHEHGCATHAIDLHAEALRIPLLIEAPGVSPGPRRALASSIDLHETVLDYAGLSAWRLTESHSLLPQLRAPERFGGAGREYAFAEAAAPTLVPYERRALITPAWALLWDVRPNTLELYDNVSDRAQRRDLIEARPEVAGRLHDDLRTWAENAPGRLRAQALRAARLRAEPTPARRVRAQYDDLLDLRGFDLPSAAVEAGGSLRLTLYYQARARTREPITIGLTLTSADGALVSDASHQPALGLHQSTEWSVGEWIRDDVTVPIDRRTPPGPVRLRFSVHGPAGDPVTPTSGAALGPEVELGEVVVTQPR